jgi:hypothetical protein
LVHARLGLPLAIAAAWVLVAATVQYLNLERETALAVIGGAGVLAALVIAVREWLARRRGIWACAGNPSLAAPSDRPGPDARTMAWLQAGGVFALVALIVGTYLYGVTLETALYWLMAYGFVHMAFYGLSLALNLEMREHVLTMAWFAVGGLYWLATGEAVAFIFGGGWLLMGVLLHARLRQFGTAAESGAVNGGDEEGAR